MIVETVHPAVVDFVPARGRGARTGLARVVTPAEIPEVDPGAFELVEPRRGSTHERHDLNRHDGALWRRLHHGRDSGANPSVTPAQLSAYLRAEGEDPTRIGGSFRTTPVAAWGRGRAIDVHKVVEPELRGDDLPLDSAKEILRDDRVRAAGRLRRFLAEDLRIAGNEVWHRVRPVLHFTNTGWHGRDILSLGDVHPARVSNTFAASPLSLDAMRAWRGEGDIRGDHELPARIEAWKGWGAAEEIERHRLRAFLDGSAGDVRLSIDETQRANPDVDLGRHRAAIRSLELDALTGGCGEDEPGRDLHLLREALAALFACPKPPLPFSNCYYRLQALDKHILPGLPAPAPVPSEDVEALSLAAPR